MDSLCLGWTDRKGHIELWLEELDSQTVAQPPSSDELSPGAIFRVGK